MGSLCGMTDAPSTKPISSNKWILGYLMQEKSVFIPSLIALFVTAALSLAFPWFLKELIGNPVDAFRSPEKIDPQQVLAESNAITLKLLAALALQALIGFFRVQGFIRAGESALNRLRPRS